ncbi:MAG TPA: hypothetical protein VN643_18800 [Pyrinomonadaceae bacterium]|nr:hypothetical protein [Pyrinomonadaceae bacterium]
MSRRIIFLLLLVFAISTTGYAYQSDDEALPAGTPIVWRDPGDIARRDLYWGPGGAAEKPDLSRVTLIKKEKGGYSTKYRVRDGSGREWVAKVGKEAQAENSATRFLWAVGFFADKTYLVPKVRVDGIAEALENVRFSLRPKDVDRKEGWKWSQNPFSGTKQFQGLKVMMALLNNWDIKTSNNKINVVRDEGTGHTELQYFVGDLGGTFGKSSPVPVIWLITRSRNNPRDFANAYFVDIVRDGYVYFDYAGKQNHLFEDITISDARWMAGLLSRLSKRQIEDAFRASNYTPAQVRLLTEAIQDRIAELNALPRYQQARR